MKTNPRMQRVISQICEKHGVDLSQPGAHLRLDMPGFDRLVIERITRDEVSVAHYREQNGDLITDPEIVFFTGYSDWVAIAIGQVLCPWARYAWASTDGKAIISVVPGGQRDTGCLPRPGPGTLGNRAG